jgi:hypothetical protein
MVEQVKRKEQEEMDKQTFRMRKMKISNMLVGSENTGKERLAVIGFRSCSGRLLQTWKWTLGILLLATVVAATVVSAGSFASVSIASSGSIKYESVPATVDIRPETLNLKSNGKWITVHITLPEGYNVGNIKPGTVKICNIAAAWSEVQNNVFMAKFDRALVQATLTGMPDYDESGKLKILTVGVAGELLNGQEFEGKDAVKVPGE